MKKDDFPTITELACAMNEGKTVPQRVTVNIESNMLCEGDGGVSPTTSALKVPGVVLLLISPMGCAVHGTEANRAFGNKGRMWLLRLEEKALVAGNYLQDIDGAVAEIMKKMPDTEAIILCGTCIDALLGTDYNSMARILSAKYGIRMTAERMDPILNDAKVNGEDRMYQAVYGLLQKPRSILEEASVNIMGRFSPSGDLSELYELMKTAGISRINYISDFRTLEECDSMTNACLNIVYGRGPVLAAKEMEQKYGIPWVKVYGSFQVDEIRENYRKIGEALGVTFNDEKYYDKVCKESIKVKELCRNFSCAVGDNIDRSTVKAAVDLVKLGFQIDAIFARQIPAQDKPYVDWLAANRPNIKVYFSKHPAMRQYAKEPRRFDMVFGVAKQLFRKYPETIEAPTNYRSFDYQTMLDFLEGICKAVKNPASVDDFVEEIKSSSRKNVMSDVYIENELRRVWKVTPREVQV